MYVAYSMQQEILSKTHADLFHSHQVNTMTSVMQGDKLYSFYLESDLELNELKQEMPTNVFLRKCTSSEKHFQRMAHCDDYTVN